MNLHICSSCFTENNEGKFSLRIKLFLRCRKPVIEKDLLSQLKDVETSAEMGHSLFLKVILATFIKNLGMTRCSHKSLKL